MIEKVLLDNLGTIIISAITLIGFLFVTKSKLGQLDPLIEKFNQMSIDIAGLTASFDEFKKHVEKDLDRISADIRGMREGKD